jgi:hypothetical protein
MNGFHSLSGQQQKEKESSFEKMGKRKIPLTEDQSLS